MPRGELDREEEAAGKIVAGQLGGTCEARDVPGAPDATHDLDVVLADGSRVPVEVTSFGDRRIERLVGWLLGNTWEAPSLGRHWWLGVPQSPQISPGTLMRKVVPHLAVLEQHDVEQVGGGTKLPPGAPPEVAEAAGAIFALGADRATRLEPPKTGEAPLVMASVHGGISGSTAAINEAVEDCAKKKVEKLRAAQGIEKHLFIWIPQAAAGIELAMATLGTLASAPTLPEGVDVVWMAYGVGVVPRHLWRVRPPGGWEQLQP
jgi:hypothetical protein